ncbi:HNH endonuclease signature motif containing protein [uncultured Microbacterium sp.]|uniref:HNH endonuclease signature motif containing protein n=1 Tax=uncultured Microbacterium sp. TaxID=191216 RepID=UPI00262943B1|nr:HNH endonuclease signature motif containing protein [uncultured Microbacterium sp.]
MATQLPELPAIEDSLTRQGELLDEWVALGAEIGALEARRAELLAERLDLLAQSRLASDEMAFRSMCAEYAAAGHVSPSTFAEHISSAWMLVRMFPASLAALSSGAISRRHADAIVAEAPQASSHPDAVALRNEYENKVLPFAESSTVARTRAHARAVAAAVFPEGTAAAHRRARGDRAVTVRADGDGMAVLTAILPEVLAYAIHDRLTSMSEAVITARPKGQRRPRRSTLEKIRAERDAALAEQSPSTPEEPVDLEEHFARQFDEPAPWDSPVLAPEPDARAADAAAAQAARVFTEADTEQEISEFDLLDPELPTEATFHNSTPMHDGYGVQMHDTRTVAQLRADILADMLLAATPTSITQTSLESVQARVQVTIAASALRGGDDDLAELDGHGPMAADMARILAGTTGSWERIFLDPRGMVVETDNYVPTASMKKFLRARDQHCRFPGCRTAVSRCQIDHNHDHAQGGRTAIDNLAHFCTSHHPLKHPDVDDRDRWTAKQLDDGVILWTSPLGRTYTDEPPLRVMFV